MKCKKIIFLFIFSTLQTICMFPSRFITQQKQIYINKKKQRDKKIVPVVSSSIPDMWTEEFTTIFSNTIQDISQYENFKTNWALVRTCKYFYNQYNNRRDLLIAKEKLPLEKTLPQKMYMQLLNFFSEKKDIQSVCNLIKNEGVSNTWKRNKILSLFNFKSNAKNTLKVFNEKKLTNLTYSISANQIVDKIIIEGYNEILDFFNIVSPNVQDKDGNTLLHGAVDEYCDFPSSQAKSIVESLLKNEKTKPNIQNNRGDTALHSMVLGTWDLERAHNAQWLIEKFFIGNKKVNYCVLNKQWKTPYSYTDFEAKELKKLLAPHTPLLYRPLPFIHVAYTIIRDYFFE